MKRRTLLAAGLAIYAVGVLALAPASLLDGGLARVSEGRLRLVDAQGTLWSGSAGIELRDAAGRSGVAKSLAWRLRPESLLRGHLSGDIWLDQAAPFPMILTPSGVEIADADIHLPATALGLGVPQLAPLGLSGDLKLHISALAIEGRQARGRISARLIDAGSTFTPVSPLGDYALELEGKGTEIQALLHTLKGPLQIDGSGSWVIGQAPDFLAIAQLPPQHAEQLEPLLRLIAVERGAGRYELKFMP